MENTFLIPSSEPGADLLCKKTRLAEEEVNALDKASCCQGLMAIQDVMGILWHVVKHGAPCIMISKVSA